MTTLVASRLLLSPGWLVRASGARVVSVTATPATTAVVAYVPGGCVVYEHDGRSWTGYGLPPAPALDLDYADTASRLLLWQALADARGWPCCAVHDGWAIHPAGRLWLPGEGADAVWAAIARTMQARPRRLAVGRH